MHECILIIFIRAFVALSCFVVQNARIFNGKDNERYHSTFQVF